MSNTPKMLSIIIPVYYNAASLPELYNRLSVLEETLAARHLSVELIFVDDGSRDNSFEGLLAIKAQRPATRLVRLTRNFGEIAAIGVGFTHATGDCVTVLAADLQDPPEQIMPMVEAWEKGDKLVFSYRRSRQDPFITKLLASCYYAMLNLLVAKNFPKGGVDMVLLDKTLLHYVQSPIASVNYALYLFMLGFEATLLPYDRQARRHGRSRWTLLKKIRLFIDTLTGMSLTPLRVISAIGLGGSLLGLLYGLEWMLHAAINDIDVPSYIIVVTLVSFLSSVMVTMLAIIGEYLWRVLALVNGRPGTVVEKPI